MPLYVAEFQFRYNNRENAAEVLEKACLGRVETLLYSLTGRRRRLARPGQEDDKLMKHEQKGTPPLLGCLSSGIAATR
jgi:hypothetical protein